MSKSYGPCPTCIGGKVHRTSTSGICGDCYQRMQRDVGNRIKIISTDTSEPPMPLSPADMDKKLAEAQIRPIDREVFKDITLTQQQRECMGVITFASDQPAQKLMAGGKTASTPTHDFHLIPTIALERLAERFSLGEKRKGNKAWNALSQNQDALKDIDWVVERLSHIITHSLKLRDKLAALKTATSTPESPQQLSMLNEAITTIKADDDAAAIAWGGCFLICATEALTDGM